MTNAVPGGPNLRGAVDLSSLVRPAAGTGPALTGIVFAANDANFTQVLELSQRVPVIVEFHGQGVAPAMRSLVESYGGRIALAEVDGPTNPQLVQAFQVTQVPTVAAVIAGTAVAAVRRHAARGGAARGARPGAAACRAAGRDRRRRAARGR